jgi:Flp pilus assembly protein TadG
MRWLIRRTRGDRGATAIVVALVLVFLVGMMAMVADAGGLYAEQRQLQNGADAGALAIAADCVASPVGTGCTSAANADAKALSFAGANSVDGTSNATAKLETGKVTVTTSTRTGGGGTVLPSWFSRVFGRTDNGTVTAKAVVTWGGLGKYSGLPVTISLEEWQQANGTKGSAPAGPYAPYPTPYPAASYERVLRLTGQDAPGSFGWLDNTNGVTSTEAGQYKVTADTGSGFKDDKAVSQIVPCIRGFQAVSNSFCSNTASTQPTVKYVPVYDNVTGSGNGTSYHIVGYAAFVLTGYQLPGVSASSWLTGISLKDYIDPATGKKFGGSEKILTGFYTSALAKDLPAGGQNLGVTTPPALVD